MRYDFFDEVLKPVMYIAIGFAAGYVSAVYGLVVP